MATTEDPESSDGTAPIVQLEDSIYANERKFDQICLFWQCLPLLQPNSLKSNYFGEVFPLLQAMSINPINLARVFHSENI